MKTTKIKIDHKAIYKEYCHGIKCKVIKILLLMIVLLALSLYTNVNSVESYEFVVSEKVKVQPFVYNPHFIPEYQ